MTNVSSGSTKYKLLLMDTGQADMGNQQGDGVIGEPRGEAWQSDRGGLAKGAGCGQRKMGQAGTWGELTGDKWRQRGDKERPHKTRDFEKCASVPKTSLLA